MRQLIEHIRLRIGKYLLRRSLRRIMREEISLEYKPEKKEPPLGDQ